MSLIVPSVFSTRLEWIDWMKAIGIYFVVLGHFGPFCGKFIYVFHMPLFFLISGFLCKKECDRYVFWRKIWYNLVVPMLIIATTCFLFHCLIEFLYGSFNLSIIYWFFRNILFGMVSGYDVLWFVYSLILLKIIYQYCSSKTLFYLLTVVMIFFAYIYNTYDFSGFPFFLNEPNAVVDVCTAYPFFSLGIFVRDYKDMLNKWNNLAFFVFSFVCGLLIVSFCCFYNDDIEMYRCGYGGNMFLFLVGGVAGSIIIFLVSKLLGHASKPVIIISRGTIIILGFHKFFIDLVRLFFPVSYFDVVFAVIIVFILIPVIIMIEKFFPLMAGKYRINRSL